MPWIPVFPFPFHSRLPVPVPGSPAPRSPFPLSPFPCSPLHACPPPRRSFSSPARLQNLLRTVAQESGVTSRYSFGDRYAGTYRGYVFRNEARALDRRMVQQQLRKRSTSGPPRFIHKFGCTHRGEEGWGPPKPSLSMRPSVWVHSACEQPRAISIYRRDAQVQYVVPASGSLASPALLHAYRPAGNLLVRKGRLIVWSRSNDPSSRRCFLR